VKSLEEHDVLRLQADASGRQPGKVCSRAGVARFVSGSGGFSLVSGLAFFQEIAAVGDFG